MKSTFLLIRWELRRVFSNWRQTVSVFLVPALVLLVSLYAFPVLVNFLSSGNVGRGTVVLVDPDETFLRYAESNASSLLVDYKKIDGREFMDMVENGEAQKITRGGGIFVAFSAFPFENGPAHPTFSEAVRKYYDRLSEGDANAGSTAYICMYYSEINMSSWSNYLQFNSDVIEPYEDYLLQNIGDEYYAAGGGGAYNINKINPYTALMSYRSAANPAAGRVIPSILILLSYYCVYSLAADTLAADRQRGFLAKLALTPAGTPALLTGKAVAVTLVSSVSSIITLLVLILSSWFNFQNAPMSLLPFGLMLFPKEFLTVLVTVLTVTLMMTAYCFVITLSLSSFQDVMLNLQIPLLFYLFEFFGHLFRTSGSLWAEYFIPAHNSLMILRDTLNGTLSTTRFAVVTIINLSLAVAMYIYAGKHFNPTAAGISETRRTK